MIFSPVLDLLRCPIEITTKEVEWQKKARFSHENNKPNFCPVLLSIRYTLGTEMFYPDSMFVE